ncbi:hypothetical protein BACCAP_00265 [Pseudoflavonifractor capillosus ATCC 29799]|uniref:Uncharacterized protein n=1 Tax=Pseudoflavonifractor capillosus ATCC 29799 TaxID=411467 RepID=A6NPZ6_9FIRM|nr:hypothetical protein BACCAP_00265 [Pseudoflavonifractor capillosus ATCC 29799]
MVYIHKRTLYLQCKMGNVKKETDFTQPLQTAVGQLYKRQVY